jgi:hypothetical protein
MEGTVLRAEKSSAITPRRKRMINVLDILEITDSKCPAPMKKIAEADKAQTEADTKRIVVEAATVDAEIYTGPSKSAEKESAENEEVAAEKTVAEQISSEKITTPAPEALKESIDYIIRHASGKRLSKEEEREAQHYAQKLKYPKGALVYNGSGEEDFCTVSQRINKYPSAERWVEASDFRSWKMGSQCYQKMNWLIV